MWLPKMSSGVSYRFVCYPTRFVLHLQGFIKLAKVWKSQTLLGGDHPDKWQIKVQYWINFRMMISWTIATSRRWFRPLFHFCDPESLEKWSNFIFFKWVFQQHLSNASSCFLYIIIIIPFFKWWFAKNCFSNTMNLQPWKLNTAYIHFDSSLQPRQEEKYILQRDMRNKRGHE